jgi:hypothetical protein
VKGEGIPTLFYDVKKRKLSTKICNKIFSAMKELENTSGDVDLNSEYDKRYLVVTMNGKRYGGFFDDANNENMEQLLEIYNMFLEHTPKFRWKEYYLKRYDENGKIIGAKDFK